MVRFWRVACVWGAVCSVVVGSVFAEVPIYDYRSRFHPVVAGRGMVASQEELATKVGVEILERGGNAVDAAVAVGFALSVTLPRAGNLGGGGFMMVHLAKTREVIALDYREKAPFSARPDLFLDEQGNPDTEKSRYSLDSVGVPGTVAGLCFALERYGSMTLFEVIQPAIRLAKYGFPVSRDLYESLLQAAPRMKTSLDSFRTFYDASGRPKAVGSVLRQPDLAWSLEEISRWGPDAFYKGSIAKKIVTYMKQHGGPITTQDLAFYSPVTRKPVHGVFMGYDIYAMPPPSSGGIHLVQLLNILGRFPLAELGHNSADYIHVLVEAMKRAYADRAVYLGDPDFVQVPDKWLISPAYAAQIARQITLNVVTDSQSIRAGVPSDVEGPETTHFSVIDADGNMVSNTYTLNFSYGNKKMVSGTGILLNNQMDDFSAKPGVPNAYGLVGATANMISPGKRMLSSMTPTLILREGRGIMATGSPGGSRIITTVLQQLLNMTVFHMNLAEATQAVRFHHQWLPDLLFVEKDLNLDTRRRLEKQGYVLKTTPSMGSLQSVMRQGGKVYGASDPRKPGAAAMGY